MKLIHYKNELFLNLKIGAILGQIRYIIVAICESA